MEKILLKIVSDSFLIGLVEQDNTSYLINYETIKSLLHPVKNFDLVVKLYSGNYDFTDDELVELSEYLRYMGSKKIFEVLVIMKSKDSYGFRTKINKYLLADYDNIQTDFKGNTSYRDISNIYMNNIYIDSKIKNINILLIVSIYYNLVDVVRYVIDNRRDTINIDGMDNSLIFASMHGRTQIVQILIDAGADIHIDNDIPLLAACKNGHKDVVLLLLDKGAYIHSNNNAPLRSASEKGHKEVVQLLLEKGARPHFQEDKALRLASINGHKDVVELLLERGANIHIRNDEPLQLASQNGHKDMVELLLDHGADIHANHENALMLASKYGYCDVVSLLLERGADITANDGQALQVASLHGRFYLVDLLIMSGANAYDERALKLAVDNHHHNVADIIRLNRKAKPKS